MEITFKDVTLAYDHQPPVFEHLNGTVRNGELLALLGPSGSGKSTLLNLLAGLLTPTAGHLYFDDQDVTHLPIQQRNVGMVFQDFALYPHLSVLDNIAFPLKLAHVSKKKRLQRARELAALVHLDDQLTKLPQALSGGQQQRVAIARALIKRPAVLLLDEPLSSLDAQLRSELRDEIRRLQRLTGVTTIFVTHDQTDALQIADRIALLAHGQIQQFDQGAALYRQPQNLFVAQFIGTPRLNTLPVAILKPYLNSKVAIPASVWEQAVTVGIRSEALVTSPGKPRFAQLPTANITRQVQLGHTVQTTLIWQDQILQSTGIAPTTLTDLPVTIQAAGCYLFDQAGNRLWLGVDA